MRKGRFRSLGFPVLIAVVLATGAALFVMLGPPRLLARSESPEFCASCHVMEAEFEAWFHEGAHRRIRCVDCHLPQDNTALHYTWKTIDGMKDVYVFYSGRVPETIRLSEHGRKVMKANCVRCHAATVERISIDRDCWECHRRLSHVRSGLISVE
jgi:cytochrome c nitrite reductase small subunit